MCYVSYKYVQARITLSSSCPFDQRHFVQLTGLHVSAFSWVWITWDRYVSFQQRENATVETSDFCADITTEKLRVVNGAVVCTGKSKSVTGDGVTVCWNAKVLIVVFLIAHVGIYYMSEFPTKDSI